VVHQGEEAWKLRSQWVWGDLTLEIKRLPSRDGLFPSRCHSLTIRKPKSSTDLRGPCFGSLSATALGCDPRQSTRPAQANSYRRCRRIFSRHSEVDRFGFQDTHQHHSVLKHIRRYEMHSDRQITVLRR